MKIEELDKNFVQDKVNGIELRFMPASTPPMELSGLPVFPQEGKYCRLPVDLLQFQNDGVKELAWCTAGVQLRFKTSSNTIAIRAKLRSISNMGHMPASGQSGFDIYFGTGKNKRFFKGTYPGYGEKDFTGLLLQPAQTDAGPEHFPQIKTIPGTNLREVTINFPLYNGIDELEIGLQPDAELTAPTPFTIQKPIVFYGSSITQGGCASRPGNEYIKHISRRLDANVINLGFSGNARAEHAMAEFINSLDMSVFVMDYDHNAPDIDFLKNTHAPFFREIREKHPDLPVVFVSKPDFDNGYSSAVKRRNLIYGNYKQAVANGDKHVFFVDGESLFGNEDRDACTVDGCHPNDLGFLRMADAIQPAIEKALNLLP